MICCFGVAYRRALRTALSARMGCVLFGSGYSLFCAVLISIRSTVGAGVTCSASPCVFSTSGV